MTFYLVELKYEREGLAYGPDSLYVEAQDPAHAEWVASAFSRDSQYWDDQSSSMSVKINVAPIDQSRIPNGAAIIRMQEEGPSPHTAPTGDDTSRFTPDLDLAACKAVGWPEATLSPRGARLAEMHALVGLLKIHNSAGVIQQLRAFHDTRGTRFSMAGAATSAAAVRFGIRYTGQMLLDIIGPNDDQVMVDILETLATKTAALVRVIEDGGSAIAYEALDHRGNRIAEMNLQRHVAAAELDGCINVAYSTSTQVEQVEAASDPIVQIVSTALLQTMTWQTRSDLEAIRSSFDEQGMHAHLAVAAEASSETLLEMPVHVVYSSLENMVDEWNSVLEDSESKVIFDHLVFDGVSPLEAGGFSP